MYIVAKLKSEFPDAPYRIWINGELITERLYTVPETFPIEVTYNQLQFSTIDRTKIDWNLENLSDKLVRLEDIKVFNNSEDKKILKIKKIQPKLDYYEVELPKD
jgi:hypothetical protein|tara:strand:- start:182 stop:493 length:312 start_codon:yes stop_codon:yes gene_type:complete